jgi:hypothetical protein
MEKGKSADEKPGNGGPQARLRPLTEDKRRLYGVLAAAGVVIVVLVLLLTSGSDDSSPSGPGAPEILSVDALSEAVAAEDPPVYWAGERQGTELELSRPEPGQTYIRYLTDGAQAGDERADFLTIGSYAQADPIAALERQGEKPGGVIADAPGNATVYFNRNQPRSVYLAYPGVEAQIEVYDPKFSRALQLVNSGQIVPIR